MKSHLSQKQPRWSFWERGDDENDIQNIAIRWQTFRNIIANKTGAKIYPLWGVKLAPWRKMIMTLHCSPWWKIEWRKHQVYICHGFGVIAAKPKLSEILIMMMIMMRMEIQIKMASTVYRTCSKILIVTLKNFDGCTSCMPSSPKEYICPWIRRYDIEWYEWYACLRPWIWYRMIWMVPISMRTRLANGCGLQSSKQVVQYLCLCWNSRSPCWRGELLLSAVRWYSSHCPELRCLFPIDRLVIRHHIRH